MFKMFKTILVILANPVDLLSKFLDICSVGNRYTQMFECLSVNKSSKHQVFLKKPQKPNKQKTT